MTQIGKLTIFSINPGLCTSYWESRTGGLYAYTEGKLHTCTREGEPITPVRWPFSIQVPERIDYDHVSRGFLPDLQVEDEPIESIKRFPHIQRFLISGDAVSDQESPNRWFCMDCSLSLPVGWDAIDGCPDCDEVTT